MEREQVKVDTKQIYNTDGYIQHQTKKWLRATDYVYYIRIKYTVSIVCSVCFLSSPSFVLHRFYIFCDYYEYNLKRQTPTTIILDPPRLVGTRMHLNLRPPPNLNRRSRAARTRRALGRWELRMFDR